MKRGDEAHEERIQGEGTETEISNNHLDQS